MSLENNKAVLVVVTWLVAIAGLLGLYDAVMFGGLVGAWVGYGWRSIAGITVDNDGRLP